MVTKPTHGSVRRATKERRSSGEGVIEEQYPLPGDIGNYLEPIGVQISRAMSGRGVESGDGPPLEPIQAGKH